jgi:hypothetical protein
MRHCLFTFLFIFLSQGQAADIVLVNQVMFQIQKEAVTTFDFKSYLKAKQDLKIDHFLPIIQNELEEFILFKLCELEVKNLDLQLPQAQRRKVLTVDQRQILLVQSYLGLKGKHISEIERYKSWSDLLKRKYNFQAKIDEIKK